MSAADAPRRFGLANLVVCGWLRGDVAQPSTVPERNLSIVRLNATGAFRTGCELNPSGSQLPSP